MSSFDHASWRCAESAQVIAHFLDGAPRSDTESDTEGGLAALDLAAHLRECPACRRELAVARRLDALVAATTPAPDARDLEHVFARLRAAGTEAPVTAGVATSASPRRRVRSRLVAILLVGLAAVTPWSLRPWRPAPPTAKHADSAASESDSDGDPATILIPDGVTSVRTRSPAPPPTEPALLARYRRHGDDEALKALVQALGAPALAEPDAALAVAASRSFAFVARLERELAQRDPPLDLLRCAARLPTTRLDAALRELGRGDVGRCELLALALRERGDVEHSVPLVLDLWTECAARHGEADPEARARRWFLRAPAAAAKELERELARTPNAERRQRCLLAIAALAAPEPGPALLAFAKGPRREEALLATYALYRCGGRHKDTAELRPSWVAALGAKPRSFCEFLRHVESPRHGEAVSETD